jgi:hypothetical protein
MNHTESMPDYVLSPQKMRHLLTQAAYWLLIWSQFLLVLGLVKIPFTANAFAVAFLGELLLILAFRELIATNIAQDFLDLTFYTLVYLVAMFVSHHMKLDFYSTLLKYAHPASTFFFFVTHMRFFWTVKAKGSKALYAWPVIGPISWQMTGKSTEPVVRGFWHSILIYILLLGILLGAVLGERLAAAEHIKEAFGGLMGFVLFFRFFRPFMKGNIALVEENIQHRTNEEKLAALIMAVQAQAGGNLNPELVKTMCHFAQLDDRTQLILAATIADVAKAIVLPANQSTYDDGDEPPKVE